MTFCLGMKLDNGLVAISDTRVTSGRAIIKAKKVFIYEKDNHTMFIMTSGLRSLRDKVITYFKEYLENEDKATDKLYKNVNVIGEIIRKVAREDKSSIIDSKMHFDIHCLIGGQLEHDDEHKLYLLYPEGNWVEITEGSPYQIIGETSYGKPILDRTLLYNDKMSHALKVGVLSFDSTRISATDVDFPIDVLVYYKDTFKFITKRYEQNELEIISESWQDHLRYAVSQLPSTEIDNLFEIVPELVER